MRSLLILVPLLIAVAGWRTPCLAEPLTDAGLASADRAQPAPDFTLPRLDGRELQLSDLRGQVVLINFWATWCPPCREEMPAIEALWQEYRDHGLMVLGVSEDTGRVAGIERISKKLGITFPVLLDQQGSVGRRYRATGLPSSVLVTRDGKIAARTVGYRDWTSEGAHLLVKLLLGLQP